MLSIFWHVSGHSSTTLSHNSCTPFGGFGYFWRVLFRSTQRCSMWFMSGNVVILKPLGCPFGGMFGVIVLLKCPLPFWHLQVFKNFHHSPIQNSTILLSIHDPLNLCKCPYAIPPHTTPYHKIVPSSMLDCGSGGPVRKWFPPLLKYRSFHLIQSCWFWSYLTIRSSFNPPLTSFHGIWTIWDTPVCGPSWEEGVSSWQQHKSHLVWVHSWLFAGNGMGFRNLCGSWVWVRVEILLPVSFKTSLCSSKTVKHWLRYSMVLVEKMLVLKGIPVGSWVWVWVEHWIPAGLPVPFANCLGCVQDQERCCWWNG